MKKRLPPSLSKSDSYKICIICEGYEEFEYLENLRSLKVWSDQYSFNLVNAKGHGNISAIYQNYYNNDSFNLVLVFCDTDGSPSENFTTIKQKIDEIYGEDNKSEKVIIFGNPCTMQIILLHFEIIHLSSHKKEDNRTHIKNLTGIHRYDARESQRKYLFDQITQENYHTMKKNISRLAVHESKVPSTNFLYFLNGFEQKNSDWINKYKLF